MSEVGPPSTSLVPMGSFVAPCCVMNAIVPATVASSAGATRWPPEKVGLGSACSQAPEVRDGSLTTDQADTSPSMASSTTTTSPVEAMAVYVVPGADGGSVKVSPPSSPTLT